MNSSAPNQSNDQELDQLLQRIDGLIATGGKAPQASTPEAARPVEMPRTSEPPRPAPQPAATQTAAARPEPPTASATPGAQPDPNRSTESNARAAQPSNKPTPVQSEKKTCSFADLTDNRDEPFIPREPKSLEEAGVSESILEEIVMRYLMVQGEASGRQIAEQVKMPFLLVEPLLNRLKYEQMTAYRGANSVNDYIHTLTDAGRDRARQFNARTTYFGSAPVPLARYCEAVKLQSVEGQTPRREELLYAFRDLLIDKRMLGKLGPAINSGRGMFLYGYPGNGKTSIAERVTSAFGKYVWIPRAVQVDGEIMRLFDPLMHEAADTERADSLLNDSCVDQRWIRIKRPTIVAGGELTMEMLEVQKDSETNISEAPLQMKSNCGVLLIDDFGRQKMRVDELLNRWIVPLEKRYDYLNMSSGKKTQVPFDQLVIFSTNLQPKDLVDDAFLRRIPYKIEVENPTETAFKKLFEIMCPIVKIPHDADAIGYLIEKHYKPTDRPMRNCHPRDLLLQVRNYCLYHDKPMELKPEYLDFACDNYFSIM